MTWRRRTIIGAGVGLAATTLRAKPAHSAVTASGLIMPRMALTMATGEPGGGFAQYGPYWGQQASAIAPVTLSYRASGGSAANILLLEQGAAQLGLTTLAVAEQAWHGTGAWTGHVKLRAYRILFPLYPASWQVISRLGGPVRRIEDLAGQRMGVGPAGGASAVLTLPLLGAIGIQPHLAITGLYGAQIDLLLRHKLDACAFFGITPLPVIQAATAKAGFRLLGLTAPQQASMNRVPGVAPMVIPRSSLPHLAANVATTGSIVIAIGRADLPDRVVAALTEAALASNTHPIDPALRRHWINASTKIAIHPGAASPLRRHGFEVPGQLVHG